LGDPPPQRFQILRETGPTVLGDGCGLQGFRRERMDSATLAGADRLPERAARVVDGAALVGTAGGSSGGGDPGQFAAVRGSRAPDHPGHGLVVLSAAGVDRVPLCAER
jgi:hypothetical protein